MGKRDSGNTESKMDTTAWMVTFADMLMLLLTFFVMLLTMSSMDDKALKSMSSLFEGATGPLEFTELKSVNVPQESTQPAAGAMELSDMEMMQLLKNVTGKIPAERKGVNVTNRDMLENLFTVGDTGEVRVDLSELSPSMEILEDERGVIIVFRASVMFGAGEADIRPAMLPVLDFTAEVLDAVTNDILVMGHSDSTPVRNSRYRSNWELSLQRALSVHRYLVEDKGIEPRRFAVGGYGNLRPRDQNTSQQDGDRNRRVEIILRRN